MTIPQQIRAARQAAGLTQQQLAERLSIAQQRIAEYESGKCDPAATMFQKIMAACEKPNRR